MIEDADIVMVGDDLVEYIFAPVSHTATVGEHRDEAHFFIDDQIVSLTIALNVISTAVPKPPPAADPLSWMPPRPMPLEEPTPPAKTWSDIGAELMQFLLPVLGTIASVGIVLAIASGSDINNPNFGIAIVGFCCSIGFWVGIIASFAAFIRISDAARGVVVVALGILCVGALAIWKVA